MTRRGRRLQGRCRGFKSLCAHHTPQGFRRNSDLTVCPLSANVAAVTTIRVQERAEFMDGHAILPGSTFEGCKLRSDGSATLPIINDLGHHLNLPRKFFDIVAP